MKSWDGGDNTIDSSRLEGEGQQRGERESWDAEMDRGKVSGMCNYMYDVCALYYTMLSLQTKKVKSHSSSGSGGEQLSSDKNLFQDFQNKRNVC